MARQIRIRDDGTIFSARSDAHLVPAPGLHGGRPSNVTRIIRNPGTPEAQELHSKASGLVMKAGETIRVETLGGGGWGPPSERPLALLAEDLRQGKVTSAAAERDYGVDMVRRALAL
jgi:N-methylhydantoinase B